MKRILVTGGAGYIGSHFCAYAAEAGHTVCVLDNLSTGHRKAVSRFKLFEVDTRDTEKVREILISENIETVVHFAALSIVSESVRESEKYLSNNVGGTQSLLRAMDEAGTKHLVFSSTAAVYGLGQHGAIVESCDRKPINPYGDSKKRCEDLIVDAVSRSGLNAAILRYFNVIGQHPRENLFEKHEPETHLVPNVLRAFASGEKFQLFGDDFATPDGTCVRDYVDVNDLADVHLSAIEFIEKNVLLISNVGTGQGNSVKEILGACEDVLGINPEISVVARREGDPPSLVADAKFFANWYSKRMRTVQESLVNLRLHNSF